MSRAVILPAPGGFAEIDEDRTVLDRLIGQIRDAGCDDVTVLTRPGTDRPVKATQVVSADADADLAHLGELAFAQDGHLFVACADLVASQTTVAAVLSDSSRRSGVLVGADDPSAAPVQVDRGLVTGPGPGPTRLGGLAKVSAAHLARLERHWPRRSDGDAFEGVLAALHARAVPVHAYRTGGLEHRQVATADEAREVIAAFEAVDMDAWRLKHAVKHDDDLFATYAVSTWSPKVVKLAARLGWTPTPITWVSIVLAVGAAAIFTTGWSPWYLAAAALMYLSFVFDCVDGQLARYTQNFSPFGGWLDMMADRSKEFLLYAGLAAGAVAGGAPAPAAWGLAIAALVVQAVRHTADAWYGVLLDTAVVRQARRRESAPPAGRAAHLGERLATASEQVIGAHRSPLYWAKRTIVAPVGERWLLLAVAAAAFGPQAALTALLAWQLLALGYTTAGRTLRSFAARTAALRRPDRAAHRDDGPLGRLVPRTRLRGDMAPFAATAAAVLAAGGAVLAAALGAAPWIVFGLAGLALVLAGAVARTDHEGILDWYIPAGLRAVELGSVCAAGIAAAVSWPVLFLLLTVIALYFYDLAVSLDKAASPVARRDLGLGWPARSLIAIGAAAAAVATSPAVATAVYALLAVYVAAVFIGAVAAGTIRASRTAAA
ncbi:CDP-alcohol phosphatidyltransferase family protein [Glycomyces terrestris]|uniref:CDP-alcohol phosphatidyltransferase family protein n=1 Tax=Glycomyces terrestris TaxID=2493553 RepID=A0A426USX2_9ACTN|nr:CDP-alcohol phosphatidyltransferase family protein [Glycomyces terrestris]RRR96557.1 CDP-alcohol phosphatidyltransferase family protein [Glycomyces terrestris]